MAGMRDVLIYKYFGVNCTSVWDVASHQIFGLPEQVEEIIRCELNNPGA